jgi:p-cumate 2,3-dioxygenase beta subunit
VTPTLPRRVEAPGAPVTDAPLLSEIAQFLYREAQLLDAWELDRWLLLMHPDITYRVPAPGSEALPPSVTLQIINDNFVRLGGRVARLKSKHAHAESPKSHTVRMISNVQATHGEDGSIVAISNFHVMRTRTGKLDHYVGSYRHTLVRAHETDDPGEPGFLIRERIATLGHGIDVAGGTVSIIL